jgi:hypothetical protein
MEKKLKASEMKIDSVRKVMKKYTGSNTGERGKARKTE